ncbi:MAG: hypothetical protein RR388_08590 [Rikenellaceae bacterium]
MNKIILYIICMLISSSVVAQNVKIIESDIVEKYNTVTVSFTAEVAELRSNEKLIITPVVYNGTQSESLQSIIISGRNHAISDRRARGTSPKALRTSNHTRVPYTTTFPYQPWMNSLSLRMERKVNSCCGEKSLASLGVINAKPIRYDVVFEPISPVVSPDLSPVEQLDVELPFLSAMSEYHTTINDLDALRAEGALIVYFKQGTGTVDPIFAENRESLAQINKILKLILSDPRATLGKIVIAGAASPEGGSVSNNALARKRADALKQYLGDSISSQLNLIEVVNIGEDWTGLREMVQQSDMQYKSEVLEIMNNYTLEQGMEKKLMDLKWGRPYNYMLANFFHKLRSAGYIRLFYEVKPSAQHEATLKAVASYNNQAYADVLTHLKNVPPSALTQMMRGACYMMLGQHDMAELTLQDAIIMGSPEAPRLLEQLHKLLQIKK